MSRLKLLAAFCGALLMGAAFSAAPAAATPMVDPFVAGAAQTEGPSAEKARIVCNAWGRCWRTAPRYYAPRLYGPRRAYRPAYRRGYYGYRRGYRRW